MRAVARLIIAFAILTGLGGIASAQYESGKDRPGNDYFSSDLPAANPALCAQNCSAQAQCKAWTYVKPGVQGPLAKCYLKNVVPMQINDACCTSGVKFTGPIPPGASTNADRPGSDISGTDLPTANPTLCFNQCNADANCQAWTFVKPGIQGPNARCYLKNPVPGQVADTCCVSGVKLPAPPAPVPPGAVNNQDRPGNDYTSFVPASPAACQDACNGQPNCQAWTYVRPGVQGPQAQCYLKNPTPAAVPNNCCISGVKAAPPAPVPPGAVNNQDRPGNDYTSFVPASPAACQNACNGQPNCQAWTYVRPGVQGPQANCYLKNPTPAAVPNNCCISGVKPAAPVPPGAVNNQDRPGNDYTSFVPASPAACQNACNGQPNCQAWTYVHPGVQGPQAQCYLKNPTPAAVPNNCCISGVKAAPPPPPPPPPPGGGGFIEPGINRPGGDYADFSSGGADTALLCLAACGIQPQCKAWTFVLPGFQGPQSHCWLKNVAPPPVFNPCCTSGVKP